MRSVKQLNFDAIISTMAEYSFQLSVFSFLPGGIILVIGHVPGNYCRKRSLENMNAY